MTIPAKTATAGLAIALLLTGCANSAKTGGGVTVNDKGNANLGIGGTATPKVAHKPVPVATHAPAPRVIHATAPVVRHTVAPTQPSRATQAPAAAFKVAINGDSSGQPTLKPSEVSVYSGTPITWTNDDKVARSVVAGNGAFKSPMLAPGASYTWTPTAAGRYDYSDGTRPYVNGQIQVTAR